MKLGVLAGTALSESEAIKDFNKKSIHTDYGVCDVLEAERIILVLRHGLKKKIPPHKINHKANISALKELGVKRVLGVCSVGSLKKEITPPTLFVPDDYISLWNVPTFHESEVKHITPTLDDRLRRVVIVCARKLKFKVISKGVYIQTTGPRLETKAEVRFLATFADVVGMTMASEATLAQEEGLDYAGLCTVDNFAHGVANEKLDFEKVIRESEKKSEKILALINAVAEELNH